ncbi:GroES-like protein [Apiospora marii]|uniref:GroES-like protein n=1 Tax=Apiospora marii TaxID=335849 RepID=A0ABR1S6W0_9PEZI
MAGFVPTAAYILFILLNKEEYTRGFSSHKQLNRALVHLHSYPGYFPSLKLVLSDQIEDLKALGLGEGAESPFTKPDLRPPVSNAWAGASLSTIETFVQATWALDGHALDRTLYLVIDDEGLRDKTCILAERIRSYEEKPSGDLETRWSGVHDYNRVRMPWNRATCMFNNLAIANMGFEDFIEDNDSDDNLELPTADGQGRWWTAVDGESDMTAEEKQNEAEELARLEKEGLI